MSLSVYYLKSNYVKMFTIFIYVYFFFDHLHINIKVRMELFYLNGDGIVDSHCLIII